MQFEIIGGREYPMMENAGLRHLSFIESIEVSIKIFVWTEN